MAAGESAATMLLQLYTKLSTVLCSSVLQQFFAVAALIHSLCLACMHALNACDAQSSGYLRHSIAHTTTSLIY
jgi:hypothetical protein